MKPPSEYSDPQEMMSDMQILGKVRTLYAFSSQAAEELSFEKDSVLEIIDKPKDDPDWCRLGNLQAKRVLCLEIMLKN